MIAAMDVVGNPSSVHSEGRLAKGLIEKARAQVSDALGADGADIVFTSGATEAAGLAMAGRDLRVSGVEHDAVRAWGVAGLATAASGNVDVEEPDQSALQWANSETGVVQNVLGGLALCDMTQGFGKLPTNFVGLGAQMAIVSSHKLGGGKGVGALVLRRGLDVRAQIKGGGQEMGRRSGTENVIGIAAFGAASEAAARDVAVGRWEEVAHLRDLLEEALADASAGSHIVAKDQPRLPNTSCIICPGWKGETQVMQMDLSGFAISAGSACSSGKLRASAVLTAMGYSEIEASSAIRVSLGLETTKDDVLRFADTWLAKRAKHMQRAA